MTPMKFDNDLGVLRNLRAWISSNYYWNICFILLETCNIQFGHIWSLGYTLPHGYQWHFGNQNGGVTPKRFKYLSNRLPWDVHIPVYDKEMNSKQLGLIMSSHRFLSNL